MCPFTFISYNNIICCCYYCCCCCCCCGRRHRQQRQRSSCSLLLHYRTLVCKVPPFRYRGMKWVWLYDCIHFKLLHPVEVSGSPIPGPLCPWENSPSTHLLGEWVGPGDSLDVLEKSNIFCPYQDMNLGLFVPLPSHNIDYTGPAPNLRF